MWNEENHNKEGKEENKEVSNFLQGGNKIPPLRFFITTFYVSIHFMFFSISHRLTIN